MVMDSPPNPTQIEGMLAFAVSALTAAYAARNARLHLPATARTWWWTSALQLLLCMEVWLGMRHASHDLVTAALQSAGLYQGRAIVQKWLLVAVLAGALVLALTRWNTKANTRRRTHAGLALACTAATWTLFLVETVSLHAVDRVLYRPIGPVLLIAYLWVTNAMVVVWLARRSQLHRPGF